jgi:hypothetical protein
VGAPRSSDQSLRLRWLRRFLVTAAAIVGFFDRELLGGTN